MSNTYRRLLADELERNGGYFRDRWTRFAIEYNVALDYVDLDSEHIHAVMCEHHGVEPWNEALQWDPDNEYGWALECMRDGLNDDCGNTTYSPATAARYGLPYFRFPQRYARRTNECAFYSAKKDGWMRVDPFTCEYFDVTFGLYGRGGKHLCVEQFEGVDLKVDNSDLVKQLRDPEEGKGLSNKWCQKLLAVMQEWKVSFTPREASAELESVVASNMYRRLSEMNREHAEVQFWAERDVMTAA